MVLAVQVKGADQLRAMADALRKADREDLRRGLDRAIHRAAKPTVEAIQESARNIKTRGERHPPSRFVDPSTLRERHRSSITDQKTTGGWVGLNKPFTPSRKLLERIAERGTRKAIADAVTADVSTGGENPRVSFRVRESKLPESLRGMPRKFDSGIKWRHPVLGNREVWVNQVGTPWFWSPIEKNIKTFRAEIERELDRVRANLEAS